MSEISEINDTNAPASSTNSSVLKERNSQTFSDYINGFWTRMKSGDLGSLPIVLGWLVLVIVFQTQNENFLTARNFVSLIQQMAGIMTIAIGVVFVLLLGEIDLSISYVSAVAAVMLALLLRDPTAIPGIGAAFASIGVVNPLPWYLALLLALGTATLIGLIQGLIITKFQLPSFVVTLAGFMVWSGVVLILVGGAGTVIIQDSVVIGVANYFLPDFAMLPGTGWTTNPELIESASAITFSSNVSFILATIVIVFYALYRFNRVRVRRKQGISARPLPSCDY